MPEPQSPPPPTKLEDAVARLESIVGRLEQGDAGLEASIALYREGRQLAKACLDRLTELERQVLLVQQDPDGTTTEKPLE